MSIPDCVADLKKAGKVSKTFADRMLDVYGKEFRRNRSQMGHEAAEATASESALQVMEAQLKQRKRTAAMQVLSQRRMLTDMKMYAGGKGKLGQAAIALLDHDPRAPYMSVKVQKQAIIGQAHAMMETILDKFRRDLLGRMPERAEMHDVIRELYGESTGNASAKELAEAWSGTADWLRRRFNAAGGAIAKLERWALPQSHDGVKVREAGKPGWIEQILPLLDRARMADRDGRPFDEKGLRAALSDVYDTITTEGWNTREPGSTAGKSLANTRAEHRFLLFKDADSWTGYNAQFGAGGTAFDAMISHVEEMSGDIARMERLGPNPTASIRMLQDSIIKEAAESGERDGWGRSAKSYANGLGKLYDMQTGAFGIPVNAKWARTMSATRSTIVSAKLGGAVISALSDTAFHAVTAHFNGVSAWKAVTGHLQLMASKEHRSAAVRMGLIAEEAGKMAAGLQRYTGESMAPGIAARLADGVMRVSGLQAWTQTGKWAFGMSLLGHLADRSELAFDVLDGRTARSLTRYGIDSAAWDHIRSAEHMNVRGATFVDPAAIGDRSASEAVRRMVLTETAYAVPEVTDASRALTIMGRPGELTGELSRSFLQFKSFGVAMLLTHGRRIAYEDPRQGMALAASLFVTTTLLGAVTLQLKELLKGKDPQPTGDPVFWARAAVQAGGFGIFGDFMQGQVIQQLRTGTGTQRASSLAEALSGPSVSLIQDAFKLGVAPANDAIALHQGKVANNTAREVVRDLKGYTPGSSLWYARLAFERTIFDQLQKQIDPTYPQAFARMEQAAQKQGQDYWWHPGQLAPERAPAVVAK